ncbi:Mpv17/PMP22 family protein [Phyllosticta citribraziliensis]|uniref:Mpv17/PMP22 family protein n=1 Tax=Phyllosticta citribraziliensis TaxID=989973 RepID=A0ABR1LCD8_9PEZI
MTVPQRAARLVLRRDYILRSHLRQFGARRGKSTDTDTGVQRERRDAGNKPNITPAAPAWVWLEPAMKPLRFFERAQARRPLLVQFISSICIWFLGDLSAQSISSTEEDGSYSPLRALRAVVIGGIFSIPSYKWFMWLGRSFNYSSQILSLATKTVFNQLTFAPLFNTYFFTMQSLLSGATVEETVERVKRTVPVSWINSCKLWPAVTAFSFAFVPAQFRSIFVGIIAIGWQTWLSLLNQRAALKAKAELEHAHSG